MAPAAAGPPTDSTATAGDGGSGDATMILTRLALASVSASLSESATFPIDTVKTHLQLLRRASSSSAGTSSNPFRSVLTDILAKGGGLAGFYSGISPAVLRHLLYTPIRIVCYENLRGFTAGGGEVSIFGKALAGGASGVLAQVVASPADLVKVRMQANPSLYTGIHDAFSKIIKSDGFSGLYRGVTPNSQRAFLVNMGELTCYDHAKHFILSHNICHDNIYAHTLSSVCSGLCASAVSCPADVVKTRMMNPAITGGGYRNSFDCLVKTVKGEGVLALWKGFFPTWARLGPWQFVFWVSYEKLRRTFGLSSF